MGITDLSRGLTSLKLWPRLKRWLQLRKSWGPFFPSIPTFKGWVSGKSSHPLDFSSGLSLRAQYAQDDRDINKWEILAERYGFDGEPGDTTFTIFFDNPYTRQELPTTGDGCKETARFSIIVELSEEEHTQLLNLKNTFRNDDFSRSRA